MLYENFFKWLTFYKRRHCEHEWEHFKDSSKIIYYDLIHYKHFKCTNCGKKEKRQDTERNGGTYVML